MAAPMYRFEGKVFIVDVREIQPETSGRVLSREGKQHTEQDSRRDQTMRGGVQGAREDNKERVGKGDQERKKKRKSRAKMAGL